MCGLTGILTRNGEPGQAIRVMTCKLRHRGPDDIGSWYDDPAGIALGHTRLAIIDTSQAGHQPMLSDGGRYVIAFNGEIYNHLELRRDLAAAGAAPNWRGHSDTETLLAAVSHWGLAEALCRSGGMFALAVWDRQERRLQLARDRMTMLVVTHEMGFAREVADRIVFMEKGSIVEQGSPDDLFNHAQHERTREFLWKITELYGNKEKQKGGQ